MKIILEVLGTEKRFFFRFFKGRCEILRERKMYSFYILERKGKMRKWKQKEV